MTTFPDTPRMDYAEIEQRLRDWAGSNFISAADSEELRKAAGGLAQLRAENLTLRNAGVNLLDRATAAEAQIMRIEYSDGDAEHWRSIAKNAAAQTDAAEAQLAQVREALDECEAALKLTECPHPANGRPADDMVEACLDSDNCGCCYGTALTAIRRARSQSQEASK